MSEPDDSQPDRPEGEPLRIPIEDVFDLHAVPARDVKAVVEAYLEEAHSLGMRHVRIIHGRGIGVQRETVRKVLARTPFVAEFQDAPLEAGGWGATIATLGPTAGKPNSRA
jgi:dsDNA-specific endonuclease/ATPase MutS2